MTQSRRPDSAFDFIITVMKSPVFGPGAVNRILSISKYQLANWDKLHYLPRRDEGRDRNRRNRTYSLADVFYLTVLAKLKELKLPVSVFLRGLRALRADFGERFPSDLPIGANWLLLYPDGFDFVNDLDNPETSSQRSFFLAFNSKELFHPILTNLRTEIVLRHAPGYAFLRELLGSAIDNMLTEKGGNK